MAPAPSRDRVLTIPNVLSVIRLVLVPVFLYLLLVTHAYGWAVAILMFSGFSDWADGKIARLVANQSSRLGELLDPLVDRIYMLAVPLGLGFAGVVPWWVVGTLIGRDAVLAATLPVVRSRGLTALPVTYIGKAATFALMSGFPLVLLGQWDATVEPRRRRLRLGIRHLGHGHVPVVGRALPAAGAAGGAHHCRRSAAGRAYRQQRCRRRLTARWAVTTRRPACRRRAPTGRR